MQEEADTKVFLCANYASGRQQAVCIHTVDTDIAIYALHFKWRINTKIFVNIGTGKNKRVLNIDKMASELGRNCCDALPALHAFSGNDYTSAFHGIGKTKAFKLMNASEEFKNVFSSLGNSFTFDANLFPVLQRFVCRLYGLKCESTNEGRYLKFIAKEKALEPQKLPPTSDVLLMHLKRVTYVTAVVKRSLMRNPNIPGPDGYGWKIEDDSLTIDWVLLPPAPEEILSLISCGCRAGCKTQACVCKAHFLKCTDLCHCLSCKNAKSDFESSGGSDSSSSDDEDSE